MIKLFDDPSVFDRLSLADPYFGPIFAANGCAFLHDPDLMNIWVETGPDGQAESAAMIDTSTVGIISGKKGPGSEMLFFVSKVLENDSHNTIITNEYAFPVVSSLFPGKVEENRIMKCTRHIKLPDPNLEVRETETFDDLIALLSETDDSFTDTDMYKLKMIRGRQHGLISTYLLYDGEKPVSTATIRGRSPKAGAIANVVTLPEYRHRGYGSFITAYCSEVLKAEGRTATLEPVDDYAMNLYSSLGFRECMKAYKISLQKDKKQ